MLSAVELSHYLLFQKSILVQLQEDILRNSCLELSFCEAEDIKAGVESPVDLGVQILVLVAEFLGRAFCTARPLSPLFHTHLSL